MRHGMQGVKRKNMSRHNTIRMILPMLLCALAYTSPILAQEEAFIDGNPVMALDDITQGLLADDAAAVTGSEGVSSLLDDLGGSAGDDPMGTDSPDDPSNIDPALPVDGGLSLLLAAGAAYGVRRLKRKK